VGQANAARADPPATERAVALQRQICDNVAPFFGFTLGPNEYQALNCRSDGIVLMNQQQAVHWLV
jgi:hypothetical protein